VEEKCTDVKAETAEKRISANVEENGGRHVSAFTPQLICRCELSLFITLVRGRDVAISRASGNALARERERERERESREIPSPPVTANRSMR